MRNTQQLRRQSLVYLHDIQGWAIGEQLRQLEHLLKRYNPNQPRVPAGHSDGGQWTSGGGGATSDLVAEQPRPKLPRIEEKPKKPAVGEFDILNEILRGAGLPALKLPKPVILNAVDDGDINDPPIEPVYPLEYLLGLGSLFRAFGALGQALGDLFGGGDDNTFERPEGMPDDWLQRPTRENDGVIYTDPKNPYNDVRIQKGNPNSPDPYQQGSYVRQRQNGQYIDNNGNPVSKSAPEGHIPRDDYIFK